MRRVSFLALLTTVLAGAGSSVAQAQSAPRPAPSLPWLLRPTAPATVVRSDTAVASFAGGRSVTTILQGNLRLGDQLAVGLRLAANVLAPDEGASASAFVNPAALVLWVPRWELPVQLAFTGVLVAPLGQGGGADADPATAAAAASGVQTRQGMDNALFATNYMTGVVGVGVGWVRGPVTLIGEATVLELVRVRDVQQDDARTNFTTGLHAGWAFWGPLALSGELHYQRWLTTPSFVAADGSRRDQVSWLVGLRGWWKVGDVKLRPGISYARAIDAPMGDASYQIIQVDLPFVF